MLHMRSFDGQSGNWKSTAVRIIMETANSPIIDLDKLISDFNAWEEVGRIY